MAVARAAEIDQNRNTASADSHVGETQAPGAAKCVTDDDRDALASLFANSRGKASRRTVRIFWKQRDEIAAPDVRMVHPGISADKTMVRFDNEHAIRPHDAARFAENYFDEPRIVGKPFSQLIGLLGRSDRRQSGD